MARASRSSWNRGSFSISTNTLSESSRLSRSVFRLARPEVSPIVVPTFAARKSSFSSSCSAVRVLVPPRRICDPVRPARPSLPAGTRYDPVRSVSSMFTRGSVGSSAMYTTIPFFKTTR